MTELQDTFSQESAAPQMRFQTVKITDPNDPRIADYYAGFSKIFTLPEIRRSEESLRQWLRTNTNADLQARNGPTEHSLTLIIDTHNEKKVAAGWDGVKFTTGNLTQEETNGYLGGAQGTYVWIVDEPIPLFYPPTNIQKPNRKMLTKLL